MRGGEEVRKTSRFCVKCLDSAINYREAEGWKESMWGCGAGLGRNQESRAVTS